MPIQVRGVLVHAMSGTELSRVRTEFRLRLPEPINKSPLESRGADIVMQSSPVLVLHMYGKRVYQALGPGVVELVTLADSYSLVNRKIRRLNPAFRDSRMTMLTFVFLLMQFVGLQSAVSPLERLRAKIAVEPVTNLTPAQFAGQYKNPSKELINRVGPPLDGDSLYIFPDGTFVYCRWGDIMLDTVFDKGTWSLSGDILELKSASEVTWDPHLERRFLAVRRQSHSAEIIVVEIGDDLQNFEKEAGNDPELMLLIIGRQRDKAISQAETAKLKAKLMREGWRPDFFRD
jgi:hypothetical protein